MPHTSRKKKQLISSKLVNVSTDDGWSVVSRKCDVESRLAGKRDEAPNGTLAQDRFRSTPPEQLLERLTLDQAAPLRERSSCDVFKPRKPHISVEKLQEYYATISNEWLGCTARRNVTSILGGEAEVQRLKGMDKLVCLGLGSLSAEFNPHGRRSAWQLAVFMDIAEMVRELKGTGSDLALYAQDPVFNAVDAAFLRSFAIEIVEDSTAFEMIDESAFVFAPHYPIAAWSEAMRCGRAGIILGNDVDKALPKFVTSSPLALNERHAN